MNPALMRILHTRLCWDSRTSPIRERQLSGERSPIAFRSCALLIVRPEVDHHSRLSQELLPHHRRVIDWDARTFRVKSSGCNNPSSQNQPHARLPCVGQFRVSRAMFSTRSISELRINVLHCQRESATFDMKSTPTPGAATTFTKPG